MIIFSSFSPWTRTRKRIHFFLFEFWNIAKVWKSIEWMGEWREIRQREIWVAVDKSAISRKFNVCFEGGAPRPSRSGVLTIDLYSTTVLSLANNGEHAPPESCDGLPRTAPFRPIRFESIRFHNRRLIIFVSARETIPLPPSRKVGTKARRKEKPAIFMSRRVFSSPLLCSLLSKIATRGKRILFC